MGKQFHSHETPCANANGADVNGNESTPSATDASQGATSPESLDCTRRDFHRLALAAVGGIVAGVAQPELARAWQNVPQRKKKEVHVCRGLNTCKGNGVDIDMNRDGKVDVNDCAGQGACATVKYITCNGHNNCRGQGGCGEIPGENECRGRGRCAVPLRTDIWKTARSRFEARMKKANKTFGPAPAREKTPQGRTS